MQAAKNMAGMVKHKVEDAAATVEEKKDVAKADAEEKVDKMRANDDAQKQEATNKKVHKEKAAEENKALKTHHERQTPIGDSPTPADLDMPVENPSQPTMNPGKMMFPQTIAGPSAPLSRMH